MHFSNTFVLGTYLLNLARYVSRNCVFLEPNMSTEIPTCSFADWILWRLREFAAKNKVAQIFADDGSSWTYDQLLQHSVHVAVGLESVGVRRGDVVSLVARNSHELFAVVFGCIFADVIIAPSIPELSASELSQNFVVIKPKLVIAGKPSLPAIEEAVNNLDKLNPKPKIFEIQTFYEETREKGSHTDPFIYKPVHVANPASHVFAYIFSSGTTGQQKAVTLTDFGIIRANYLSIGYAKRCSGPLINTSQPNWISWWCTIFRCFIPGWTRIFLNKVDTKQLLDAIHRFKPDVCTGATSVLSSVSNSIDANPGQWDISSLKIWISGGDILTKGPHEYLRKKLNVDIIQCYGSTETSTVTFSPEDVPIVCGSVGKPLGPIKLVDTDSGDVITQPHTPGEIVVKYTQTVGYVDNPEATKNAFDESGWFKTGDIGLFDENGNFFIVDRIKEMFKYCGYQIAPTELEDIIKEIPGVKEVAVVGKPVGMDGDVPTAFVVKDPAANITERDILDYLEKKNLHDSKKLRGGVIFIDKLPRNAVGKIVRAKLRKLVNTS